MPISAGSKQGSKLLMDDLDSVAQQVKSVTWRRGEAYNHQMVAGMFCIADFGAFALCAAFDATAFDQTYLHDMASQI